MRYITTHKHTAIIFPQAGRPEREEKKKEIVLIRYIQDKIENVIFIHSHYIKRMINAIQLGIYLEKNIFQRRKIAFRYSLQFHALREYAYFQFGDLFYFAYKFQLIQLIQFQTCIH